MALRGINPRDSLINLSIKSGGSDEDVLSTLSAGTRILKPSESARTAGRRGKILVGSWERRELFKTANRPESSGGEIEVEREARTGHQGLGAGVEREKMAI